MLGLCCWAFLQLWCTSVSSWQLLSRSTDSRACGLQQWCLGSVGAAPGLQSTGSVAVLHGLGCFVSCGIFLDQGQNPCLLHQKAESLRLSHQESPAYFHISIVCLFSLGEMSTQFLCPSFNLVVDGQERWENEEILVKGYKVQLCTMNKSQRTAVRQNAYSKQYYVLYLKFAERRSCVLISN